MRPAKAGMLVVGIWMGLGGLPAGSRREPAGGAGAMLLGWVGEGIARAANAQAEGRKHARKANHLAEINKCKLAIPEYTKALRLLKDPTLLFNRAECYRRTGEAAKAVADYRKFLVELPAAPNRVQVESQIAALDRPRGKSAAAASAARTPASRATAAPAKTTPPEPVAAAPPSSSAVPAPVAAPPLSSPTVAEEPAGEAPAAPEPEAPDLDRPRRPPRLRTAARREPAPALIDSASRHPDAAEGGSSHWWAWVLGAVVIAGGVTGTYFALKQGKTDIPSSPLGNYKF